MIVSSNVVCFCDLVCQEYANLPYGIVNLANNHGTVVGVQCNAGIGTRRVVYSINLATEGDQYYFVYLNDIKCTLRCSGPQHRHIPHCAHKTVLRHQLKERGGKDLSKMRKTNLAMRHRSIWDPVEGIQEDDEKINVDAPGRWVPPPKYMMTDDDDIGYETVESDEWSDRYFDDVESDDQATREREYLIQQRKDTRAKYYDYKYQAPDACETPLRKYLFSLRFMY